MASIFVQLEYRLEGGSNFKTWTEMMLIIIEEHDLDVYMTSVSEEYLSNAERIKEQVNMHHFSSLCKR